MPATFRVLAFTAPSGGSYPQAQVLTLPNARKVGAVPSGAMLFMCSAANLDTIETTGIHGILCAGFSDFTRSRAIAYTAEHNITALSADAGYRIDIDTIAQLPAGSSEALLSEATIAATGDDEVTLTWSANPAGARSFIVLWFTSGGDQVYVGHGTSSASAGGTVDITDPGFQPDDVYFGSVDHAFVADGSGNGAMLSFGFWSRQAAQQAASCSVSEDRVTPTSIGQEGRADACVVTLAAIAGVVTESQRLNVTTALSNGFTIRSEVVAHAVDFMYFAVKHGGLSHADGPDLNTTAVASVSVTSPGFRPNAACIIGHRTAGTTIQAGGGPMSIAFIDRYGTVGCVAMFFQDNRSGANLSVAASYASETDIAVAISSSSAFDWKGDWDSFDATGFTFSVNDASGGNRSLPYIVQRFPVDSVSWLPHHRRWRRQLGRM